MKVAYVSDIHAEFLNYPNLHNDQGGDVLLLAGDIFTASMIAPLPQNKPLLVDQQ